MTNTHDELDALKSAWKSQKQGKSYSAQQIFTMLRRKSITSVKWIFYISLIELCLGALFLLAMALQVGFSKYHEELMRDLGNWSFVYEGMMLIAYFVTFYFIYKFFKAYKEIKVESSVAALSKQIINFRKTVNHYIYFNVGMFILLSPLSVAKSIGKLKAEGNITLETDDQLVLIIVAIFIGTFVVFALLYILYFYLVYGTFLRRLKRNLNELKTVNEI